jgi:hypothetical protein
MYGEVGAALPKNIMRHEEPRAGWIEAIRLLGTF